MSKNAIDRREVLRALGVSAALPVIATVGSESLLALSGYHPLVPRQEGEWRPRFLSPTETELVSVVCELIVPETDTPGARAARVEQYIDFVLSETSSAEQTLFQEGLAWLERASQERFGSDFVTLDEPRQVALLQEVDDTRAPSDDVGSRFYRDIKQRTVEGYYRSEVGMLEELRHDGNTFLADFEGCTHPGHLSWRPTASRPDDAAD